MPSIFEKLLFFLPEYIERFLWMCKHITLKELSHVWDNRLDRHHSIIFECARIEYL